MWKQEAQEVKDHYQALAQQSREQHQRDYPGYKYAPRRPGERKRRGVHQEIVFGDSETASNTEESLSFDMKSPADYEVSPTPSGDYFRFTSNGSYYQDMLGMSSGVDSPDEFNLCQFHPSHSTSRMTSTSDPDHGWSHTPPVDQTPELQCLDAGHPDSEYEGNAYGVYQGTITLSIALNLRQHIRTRASAVSVGSRRSESEIRKRQIKFVDNESNGMGFATSTPGGRYLFWEYGMDESIDELEP